jgi:PTS system fructose-specific IIC component
MVGGVFAANGYTISSLITNQGLTGDDSAVSGFLGALLAGFVAGIIVNLLKKAFNWLPKAMDGIKPVFIYPLLGTVLIGLFMLLINPIIGVINIGISNGLASLGESSKILLSIVLAAMMSIDMGGPFNKAAYAFGCAVLTDATTSNDWIMAAVMIGGMVPPIAIAISTMISKKKWTKEERKNGPVNYLMGLCFITEGAIPYAAADPLRVIPSCMVGSAVAGALSAVFNCSLPAPHGGIFTFVVADHPFGYIVALVVGSFAGALMLAILKKNKTEE